MEYGSGGSGGSPGEHHHHHNRNDASSSDRGRKKRYHRHTANQIQRLEAMFKECNHPDEKQRNQLSRELGLLPRQIKFWFQNRRTQQKAQHERGSNSLLRAENDRIRCENIVMREALKNVICPSCGGPPLNEDSYFDDQKLRLENAQLKEQLDQVSSIAAKYIGRPISQLPPVQPIHLSTLDLSMGGSFGGPPSLDLDLLHGSSSIMPSVPYQPARLSEMDKSLMSEIASNAMSELIKLLQTNEPLWMKSTNDGRDVLNLENYERLFPKANSHMKNPNVRIEASRDSEVVIMNALTLVDMFMDPNKWMELFPTIVSMARTIEIISTGMLGSHNGSLQLMFEELHVLSPYVSTREFYFLRFCQQLEPGSWAIVDVSYDFPQDNHFAPQFRSHRLPSGCFIQDMPNGYSKVTWIEHVEIEDKAPVHRLYRNLIYNGMAFGAQRWLAVLQRMCERLACLMVSGSSTRDLESVITPEGKRCMMRLAQRMVNIFCAGISISSGQRWVILSGVSELNGVRVAAHRNNDPANPNSVVLSAATTIWLPLPPQTVFNFLRDQRNRPQWDILTGENAADEVFHIANGSNSGNNISVIRAFNTSQNNNSMILQESCIDSSNSLVVFCPVDISAMNVAMSGEDPSFISLLPSGFAIFPDGEPQDQIGIGDGASTSSNTSGRIMSCGGGSLVTVAFQIMVNNSPSARLNMESVQSVSKLITHTIHQIKVALQLT